MGEATAILKIHYADQARDWLNGNLALTHEGTRILISNIEAMLRQSATEEYRAVRSAPAAVPVPDTRESTQDFGGKQSLPCGGES